MDAAELGGKHVFEAVVDNFYARVLLDQALAPFFANASMAELRRHQVEFLSCVLSGDKYQGRSMAEAHKNMGITEEHFGNVAAHLAAALDYGHVDVSIKDKLLQAAANLKNEIVNK